jgi:ketosteroid isomerase-like protein
MPIGLFLTLRQTWPEQSTLRTVTSDLSPDELADRLHIEDLLTRYACAVDARDWDVVASAFTPDAVLDYSAFGGPRGSVEDAVSWIGRALTPIAGSQHMITNLRVEVDGDLASARSYVFSPLVIGPPDREQSVMLTGGEYADRLQRTPDGWRIIERTASLTWSDRPVRPPR